MITLSQIEIVSENLLARIKALTSKDRRHDLIVPQPHETLRADIQNASEAICILLLLAYLKDTEGLSGFYFFDIREQCANSAYNHKYQGKWEDVQDILEQEPTILGWVAGYTKRHHPNEIFGNIVRRALRLRFRIRSKRYYSVSTDTRIVRKKVRKRGYDDKGTLRPSHKWLPAEGLSDNPRQRKDKRDLVIYNLKSPFSHKNQPASGAFPVEHVTIGGDLNGPELQETVL